jgi:hypothetical protein
MVHAAWQHASRTLRTVPWGRLCGAVLCRLVNQVTLATASVCWSCTNTIMSAAIRMLALWAGASAGPGWGHLP